MLSASLIQLEYASKHWKSTFSYLTTTLVANIQIKRISCTIPFVGGRLCFVRTRGCFWGRVINPSAFLSSGFWGWAWPWFGRTFCCRPVNPSQRLSHSPCPPFGCWFCGSTILFFTDLIQKILGCHKAPEAQRPRTVPCGRTDGPTTALC